MNQTEAARPVTLHTANADGTVSCQGFEGASVIRPVRIVLHDSGSPAAQQACAELCEALEELLKVSCPDVQTVDGPCVEHSYRATSCHGRDDQDCVRLLVLVGDEGQAFDAADPVVEEWLTSATPDDRILPVLAETAQTKVSALVPWDDVRRLNAVFWKASAGDVAPDVLVAAGLADSWRVFISYRRTDALEMAEQLARHLTEHRFSVFLDRYSIPVGADFQAHLTDDLADKAMVLLIESETILDSPWTVHEINFAKAHQLGVLALHLPTGQTVPRLKPDARVKLTESDLTVNPRLLTDDALARVFDKVREAHCRASFRRRKAIYDEMQRALSQHGVAGGSLTAHGMLRVTSPAQPQQQYALWLTTRPPGLEDFHWASEHRAAGERGVVAGATVPTVLERNQRMQWLAKTSQMAYCDKGRLRRLARQIKDGKL